jgi:hypothetical protein
VRILAALPLLLAAACGAGLPYSTATPPLILAPAGAAGVADGRARFREIFCAVNAAEGAGLPYARPCAQALHSLDDEAPPGARPVDLGPGRVKLRILTVPGIFGECAQWMATPFEDATAHLAGHGWSVGFIPVSGRSGSAANADAIRLWLKDHPTAADERLVLIGHSKGMSDLIELIAGDRDLVPPGSTIVSLTGVVAGTPIADRGESFYDLFRGIPLPGCGAGDNGGVASLTRRHRLGFLARNKLPDDLHYFSLPAFTRRSNISSFLKPTHAALARIDARNDGNVIFHDSVIPGSTLLGYLDADHWAVAMPFTLCAPFPGRIFASRNGYPRVVLLEAIARTVEEMYLGEAAGGPAAGGGLTAPLPPPNPTSRCNGR